MMLRASVQTAGGSVDLQAVVERDADSDLPHGSLLCAFAEALVGRSPELPERRADVLREIGSAALIDAAGTVANFQRMVRIADGTGIPLDDMMRDASHGLRDELGLNRFGSAANTPG